MFKYIASILAQMSPQNKFKSLVALLISIVLIALLPTILDSITTSDTECQDRIARLNDRNKQQYVLIDEFQDEIDRLNTEITKRSSECTRKILERDSYWREQIKYIRTLVSKMEQDDIMIYGEDTIMVNPTGQDVRLKEKAVQNMDYLIYKK